MKKAVVFRATVIGGLLASVVALSQMELVFATPNNKIGNPPNGQSAPGGNSAGTASYSGQYEYSKSESLTEGVYDSALANQNTILVTGGTVNFRNATIAKSGDSSGDETDFYGINAAVLSTGSSKIKMNGGNVTTSGQHANAVFAYGDSTIDINGTKIQTTANNSGGIMVTGGGTLKATDLEVETYGNSSAPIRSDRGGGVMEVIGGQYTSNGIGSPAIYSTAEIKVKSGTVLKSNASEGVVIEGANSVAIDSGVSLIANNTQLNGNSETFKSIFIYQSMSGDANEGTGNFSIKDSFVHTLSGDTFFVTNTTANIDIEHSSFDYGSADDLSEKVFLRAQAGKWGTAGRNGGIVTMNIKNSPIIGNIVLDNISTLTAKLTERTSFMGAINPLKTAKEINIMLDSNSRIILTGDSYISSLVNDVTDNSNIYANGHKLYVGGVEATINQGEYEEWFYNLQIEEVSITTGALESQNNSEEGNKILAYSLIGAGGALVIVVVILVVVKKKKTAKRAKEEEAMLSQVENNNMKKPWENKGQNG